MGLHNRRYEKNHPHIQHRYYRGVSRLETLSQGVEVEVSDPTRTKIRVLGTLSLGKHCMTSQQAVMMS
uniref:Uncharacterized protein n=1 Tax=Arundo donax TaxID=35708 RepID=A0A0A9E0M5_ARUDO